MEAEKEGAIRPSSVGPKTTPATISPMTFGWRSLANKYPKRCAVAMRISSRTTIEPICSLDMQGSTQNNGIRMSRVGFALPRGRHFGEIGRGTRPRPQMFNEEKGLARIKICLDR